MPTISSIQDILKNPTYYSGNSAYLIENPKEFYEVVYRNNATALGQNLVKNFTPVEAARLLKSAKVISYPMLGQWGDFPVYFNQMIIDLLDLNSRAPEPTLIDHEVIGSSNPLQRIDTANNKLGQRVNCAIIDSLSPEAAVRAMVKPEKVAGGPNYLAHNMALLAHGAPIVKRFIRKLARLSTTELEGFIGTAGHFFLTVAGSDYSAPDAHKAIIVEFYTLWPSKVRGALRTELKPFNLDTIPELKKSEGIFNEDMRTATQSKGAIPFLIENPEIMRIVLMESKLIFDGYLQEMNVSQRVTLISNAREQKVPLLEKYLSFDLTGHYGLIEGVLEDNGNSDPQRISTVRTLIAKAFSSSPIYFMNFASNNPTRAEQCFILFSNDQLMQLGRSYKNGDKSVTVLNGLIRLLCNYEWKKPNRITITNMAMTMMANNPDKVPFEVSSLPLLLEKGLYPEIIKRILDHAGNEVLYKFLEEINPDKIIVKALDTEHDKVLIKILQALNDESKSQLARKYTLAFYEKACDWINVNTSENIARMRAFYEAAPQVLSLVFTTEFSWLAGRTVLSFIVPVPPSAPPPFCLTDADEQVDGSFTQTTQKPAENQYQELPKTAKAPPPLMETYAKPEISNDPMTFMMKMICLLMVQGEQTRTLQERMQAQLLGIEWRAGSAPGQGVDAESANKIAVLEQVYEDQSKLIEAQDEKIERLLSTVKEKDSTIAEQGKKLVWLENAIMDDSSGTTMPYLPSDSQSDADEYEEDEKQRTDVRRSFLKQG